MIKDVNQATIADIFSINSNTEYRIPKYQREYTWGKNEWDSLFNDVTDNEAGYFLGSYICVNNGSLNGTRLEVIDGQQRFATITILLTVLYEKLFSHKSEMDEDDLIDLANLRNELTNKRQSFSVSGGKNTEYLQRLFLQKQNSNDEDYSYILSNAGISTSKKKKPAYFGIRRIAKAYRHFCNLVDTEIGEIMEANTNITVVGSLFQIIRKFEAAVLVGIEVDSNKDAYMLFESLNHRGVPLSAIDLIKNTLISKAESISMADAAYEQWKEILAAVSQDDYGVQERFFRQYYNAFRDELNKPYSASDKMYYLGYLATRTTLLDIYEKMIKYDYLSLLTDLTEKSKFYSVIINNSDEEHTYTNSLQNLERISGAPSYILLLYLLSNQTILGLSEDDINEIVNILIIFFVRRNLTDVPNTRKLSQLFINIISETKHLQGKEIVDTMLNMLKSVSASDSMFEEKLRGQVYEDNPDAARFVLCNIESQHQTKEIYSDLWSRDSSNKYVWTIEHIFPEGENIPSYWIDMVAKGDADLAKKYRQDYVHTIGNLTITGYNQNLSNMSFDQKRDRMSKDKTKHIGYRNGLYLNNDVVGKNEWTIDDIKTRTDDLVKTLLGMYKW